MRKIIIIGNSGSGKSWLSNQLSRKLDCREVNLDALFWQPGGYSSKRPKEIIYDELKEISLMENWVVEGVFGDLVDKLINSADTLVFLDMSWALCEKSLLQRGAESAKQDNQELAEDNFKKLLVWASEYYQRDSKSSFSYHDSLYSVFVGRKFRFCDRDSVTKFLDYHETGAPLAPSGDYVL